MIIMTNFYLIILIISTLQLISMYINASYYIFHIYCSSMVKLFQTLLITFCIEIIFKHKIAPIFNKTYAKRERKHLSSILLGFNDVKFELILKCNMLFRTSD